MCLPWCLILEWGNWNVYKGARDEISMTVLINLSCHHMQDQLHHRWVTDVRWDVGRWWEVCVALQAIKNNIAITELTTEPDRIVSKQKVSRWMDDNDVEWTDRQMSGWVDWQSPSGDWLMTMLFTLGSNYCWYSCGAQKTRKRDRSRWDGDRMA